MHLKVLEGASHLVICFGGSRIIHSLIVYYDVDYVVDLHDRKSRSGRVVFEQWSNELKKPQVNLPIGSTNESKYIARCKRDEMNQQCYFRKGLHIYLPKKTFSYKFKLLKK
jgi:hypothetical protein